MEVISRLFNHKPAVQGELVFFTNEFETILVKEDALLVEIESSSKRFDEQLLPSCTALIENDLAQLQSKVRDCCELSQRVFELDQSATDGSDKAESSLDDEFLKSVTEQKEAIQTIFDEAVSKLKKEYDDFYVQLKRENASDLDEQQ